jgi:hypothetical protein
MEFWGPKRKKYHLFRVFCQSIIRIHTGLFIICRPHLTCLTDFLLLFEII